MYKAIRIVFCVAVSVFTAVATGATRTYIGTDGKWTTASNWSPEGVPEAGDTATFTATATITESFDLPQGVTKINNTSGTLTFSGVIGGEGAALVHSGSKLVLGSGNTFTGSFTNESGEVTAPLLANASQPSSVGAGDGMICFKGGGLTVSQTCATDRDIFYPSRSTFYVGVGKTLTLDGGFYGGIWQRNNAYVVFNGYLGPDLVKFSRTDEGGFYINCPTNDFTCTPSLSNGAFYYATLSNCNEACSLGAGIAIQSGQRDYPTPGSWIYTGSVDVFCDRTINIYSCNGKTSGYPGGYNYYDGPTFNTQNAGVKQTFTGEIKLMNSDAKDPFIKFAGPGDVEIASPIPERFHVRKAGSGTSVLSGDNAATGKVEVISGRLDIDGSYAEGAEISVKSGATLGGTGTVYSAVVFSDGAKLQPGKADSCGAITFGANAPSFLAGAGIDIKIGDGTNDVVHIAGTPAMDGIVTINVSRLGEGDIPDGKYTLMTYGQKPVQSFMLENGIGDLTASETALVLTVGAVERTWAGDGTANVWDTSAPNWDGGTVFSDGEKVFFTDSGSASPPVRIAAAGVKPLSVTISADEKDYVFTGGEITGGTSMLKEGSAGLVISNDLTFAGALMMTGGSSVLAGDADGPSVYATGDAGFIQDATSKISGENIVVSLGYGNCGLKGTNDFTGTVILDADEHPISNASYTNYLYNARSFGYAKNVVMVPKMISGERYTYIWWLDSFKTARDMTLSVRCSTERRMAAFYAPAKTRGGWLGDIVSTGSGVQPGLAVYVLYSQAFFDVGTLGETKISGLAEFRLRGMGTVNFYGLLDCADGRFSPNDGTTVNLFMPGNSLKQLDISYGRINFMTNFALASSVEMNLGKDSKQWGGNHWSDANLNGTTQMVALVNEKYVGDGGWRRITSERPATLIVNGSVDCAFGSASAYGDGTIDGAVSIVKDGTSKWTLNGTNSFTGTVEVKGGVLAANCAKALPETTTVIIGAADGTSGTLELDVAQKVRYLWIDGKCRPKGIYGGASSSADIKLDCFSGSATLTVLRDKGGMRLIFK